MPRDTFDMFSNEPRGRFGEDERPPHPRTTNASTLIDLAMVLHHETSLGQTERGAVLVSSDGNEATAIWIPKSQCQIEPTGKTVRGTRKNGQSANFPTITLTLETWQAQNKGLI